MPSENALPCRPTSFSIQNSKPQARIQNRFSCRPDAFKPKGNSGTTKPNRPTASGQNHEKTHPLPNRRCRHIRGRIRRRAHRRIGSSNRRFGRPHRRIGAQRQHGIPPNRSVYVCSVTPFRKTFEAADNNEGLARGKVRRACNAETSAMFCEDRDIRCKRFD